MAQGNQAYHQSNQGLKRKRDFDKRYPQASDGIVFKNPDFIAGAKKDQESSASKKQPSDNASRRSKPRPQDPHRKAQPEKPTPLTEKRKKLLQQRSSLPIASHASTIRLALHGLRDVLLLVGETGSGKSTQVPQFLMGEGWCSGQVAITQPRRVAAISLAKRVAEEMGTTLGTASPASKVGYSVRFDQNVAPACKVKFLTDGMLLQELLRDPWLKDYSVVIVDEVHERGVNVDLVLGFLRRILVAQNRDEKKARKGKGRLKVVVMSATADTEKLYRFFEEGFLEMEGKASAEDDQKPKINGVGIGEDRTDSEKGIANGSTNGHIKNSKDRNLDPRKQIDDRASDSDSDSTWSGFSGSGSEVDTDTTPELQPPLADPEAYRKHHQESMALAKQNTIEVASDYISTLHIEGRQHPVEIYYAPEPTNDFVEASLKSIFQIHYKEPLPGDVLVFLTGQDTVEALEKLVNEHAAAMGPEVPKIQALPLFAALPQNLQSRIFNPTPHGTRKVIISTNIAETSLTIPGVVHVIDSGLAKIKEHRPGTGLSLSSLLVKPISKSSALQRKGRAGRERPGKCWRLYPEKEYLQLEEATAPEILRSDVAEAVLVMKSRGIGDPLTFPLLDRPPADEVRRAMLALLRLGALDEKGSISPDGRTMARLPLVPSMARVLVSAGKSTFKTNGTDGANGLNDRSPDVSIILAVIDIIAALTVESLFLPLSEESAKEEADVARRELLRREGDHLTLLSTVRAFASEESDRKAWCETRFVSHRAMRNVMDVRKQLRGQCVQQHLLSASDVNDNSKGADADTPIGPEAAEQILKCFLRGFVGNVAVLQPDRSYRTVEGNQTVAIHPGSVLFGRKLEAILYNELVFTSRCYARGISAIQMDWWGEVAGAGGS